MEKRKIKINIVDAIVIIAILAVLAFATVKIVAGFIATDTGSTSSQSDNADSEEEKDPVEVMYRLKFYTDESTWYSLEPIKKGDRVTDDMNGVEIGKVTVVDVVDESCAQLPAADGTYKVAHRPGYGSGTITFEGKGEKYNHGAKMEYAVYSIGQTVTLRVGNSKVYGRISDIEIIKEIKKSKSSAEKSDSKKQ